ncbi:hypothetical protein GFC01_17235 [Desulfofundulus thermobenzoicus]|uniref:SAF domain-containing protein n=1 Tax=Desulfofundulus thermobenzoicus TaxID=29376 RepID=A0A6N7IWM7_9FIRM|nr:hypothetical protein [Desulfofundulus thermobenzoicus]MQL53969.1 hypothetical protein [Desulfofundulus thermobenzoicus]
MERKKLFAILISLFIALIVTLVIIHAGNAKYVQASKTVKAYEAVGFIPARTVVQKDQVKEVQVPASLKGLATDVIGKSLLTSVMPGNLIYQNEVSPQGLKPGFASVTVQTTLATSGNVTAGDTVDVYVAGDNRQAAKLAGEVEVLAVLDSGGNYIAPGGNIGVGDALKSAGTKVPAAVELMVPVDKVQDIVANAKQPGVYLVRVK